MNRTDVHSCELSSVHLNTSPTDSFKWNHCAPSQLLPRSWLLFKVSTFALQGQMVEDRLFCTHQCEEPVWGMSVSRTTGRNTSACITPSTMTRKTFLKKTLTIYELINASASTPSSVDTAPCTMSVLSTKCTWNHLENRPRQSLHRVDCSLAPCHGVWCWNVPAQSEYELLKAMG